MNVVASSFNADQAAVNKLGGNFAISGFRPGITLDLSSIPFKSSYEVVYTVNTGVTDIIDTAASNAVVKELHFITDASASDSGVLVTIAPDGASGTSLGLVPNAAAQLFPGDVVVTDIAGKAYSSIAMHYFDGAFTGENRFYYTNTGNAYTSYVAASNGIEQFSVSGGQGMQQIVGTQDYNAITTANAAGTGMVAVDLAGGTVSKGATQLASLKNVQIVQLGSDASVLKGLASNFDLLYGGSGADTFVGQGANDYIQGGTAANQVLGGTGNEVFYGNGGTDSMTGGSGANFMQGGAASTSNDMFYGTTGNDYVYSQAGTTTVHAGAWHDVFRRRVGHQHPLRQHRRRRAHRHAGRYGGRCRLRRHRQQPAVRRLRLRHLCRQQRLRRDLRRVGLLQRHRGTRHHRGDDRRRKPAPHLRQAGPTISTRPRPTRPPAASTRSTTSRA